MTPLPKPIQSRTPSESVMGQRGRVRCWERLTLAADKRGHRPTETNPVPDTPAPPTAVGFLSVVQEAGGVLGGYLVTNLWGRPLEFRLSTAVQPNRVQQILYGPTLTEYLYADLIGKTLVEKTGTVPGLIITDSLSALALRDRVGIPVLAIVPKFGDDGIELIHARASVPLILADRHAEDRAIVVDRLDRLDPAVDLVEPFARIREAIAEARKMGVASRAA